MPNRTNLNLSVDLQRGVVPISKAASSLAALIKRAHSTGQPVIVTQKGYPTGVLLPIELFAALKALAEGGDVLDLTASPGPVDEIINAMAEGAEPEGAAEEAPKSRRPATRRRKGAGADMAESDS
jgi:prevent-host-death family protein